MATPKVFVSSTCYDLAEERAQLERFISNYGFQPILSEYSGVFYNPDEHTHDACVKEVENCDIFILIISGRFGGKLKGGDGESITQAEYNSAKKLNLPIFAFVKSDVLNAQYVFKENARIHGDTFATKINYPAIENQDDAIHIFNFIQQVQRSQTNNAIEQYNSFSDIEDHLKKQWAGMFYSFLQKRKELDKVAGMTLILEQLSGSSSKLESLVSSLHDKEVGEEQTKRVLKQEAIRALTLNFYQTIRSLISTQIVDIKTGDILYIMLSKSELSKNAQIDPSGLDFLTYLSKLPLFSNAYYDDEQNIVISYRGDSEIEIIYEEDLPKLQSYFTEGILESTTDQRYFALSSVYINEIT